MDWRAYAALASAPVTVTVRGTVRVADGDRDGIERVTFAPEDSWRIEDADGSLRYLANDAGHFQYPAGGGPVACFQPRQPGVFFSGGMAAPALILPRDLVHPRDDDFTRPVGGVEEATYLGRRAWRAVLAPPARKPYPMVQVVDDATGLILAMLTADDRLLIGFVELETGTAVPDDTFVAP